MTNYERIKAMSIDEMADFLSFFSVEDAVCSWCNPKMRVDYCRTHYCIDCVIKFLAGEDGE